MNGLRPLRILHLPVDLGGHARALAAAQRALGHEAVSISLEWSPYGFNGDECLGLPFGTPGRLFRREAGRARLIWRSLAWADVVHCHFGQTAAAVRPLPLREPGRGALAEAAILAYARALWLSDMRLWCALGKRVAMTFYGDDVRPVALALRRNPWTHLAKPALRERLAGRDAAKAALVAELVRYGVTIFATNPDLLTALPEGAAFLPYGHVDPAQHSPCPPAADGPLRLLHIPTNREVKGTAFFIEAVDRLRARGVAVQLTLVEGRDNEEVLKIIAAHDVLLDQLRVGWFGGVAVEAMALAKPVVAFLHPGDEALVPAAYRAALPLVRTDPAGVEAVLARLAAMPREELCRIGFQSRTFVEKWHAPDTVARATLKAYGRPV